MRLSFFALLGGLLLCICLPAQSPQTGTESIFVRLSQYDPLEVLIETDIKQLRREKNDDQWQPAVFKVFRGDSIALQLDVLVTARGNMRRKTCQFPPVKIRFSPQNTEPDSLADTQELKLVSSCKNTALDEQWVQKEYLLYELYNLLTEQSFRVKKASIRFANPGKKAVMQSFSFLLESEKEMAARLNARPMKPKAVSFKGLDPASADRMSVFQYMIGNTDWSVRVRHNVKILYLLPEGPLVPIPYDFDYAALVGTDYSAPSPQLPIQSVQERYFMGLCRDDVEFQKVFDLFLSKKEAILKHCEQFPDLPKSVKKQMTNYIEEFYNIIKSPELVKRDIKNTCGKIR
ncbi:MAG: hypothetical protein IPJ82_14095 [Lewinellaceae bacterium]|nr:hypothetical protein [Lewinellaceae bacterium]